MIAQGLVGGGEQKRERGNEYKSSVGAEKGAYGQA
jgi:hypothetical protein